MSLVDFCAYLRSMPFRFVDLALAAKTPKAVFSTRRISRGNSLSGVSPPYHMSYMNCRDDKQRRLQPWISCQMLVILVNGYSSQI